MAENVTFPVTLTNPAWLDKGDNAWQLTAASLVALQSVPGLVVLYAGWVKHKWAVNSAFMAFYAFGAVLICWVLWAYKESFGNQMLPFVGMFILTLSLAAALSNRLKVFQALLLKWVMS